MSDAKNFSVDFQINPYYGSSALDRELAEAEHSSIKESLYSAGVEVIQVESPIDSQDGVYTANWALVRSGKAILARLPEVRKTEENHAEKVLTDMGIEVIRVPDNLRFSGQGDALPCGEYLFCGQDYRSDEAAQDFVAKILDLKRIQLKTIPQTDANGETVKNKVTGWNDSFFYDIDLALAVIKEPSGNKKGLIAYCPEAFTEESCKKLAELDFVDKIEVSLKEATEAFATNLVSTGEAVVMSDNAPLLAKELRSRGLQVITPHIEELSKGGGYIRCTTLTIT